MEERIITFDDIQKANETIKTTDIKGKDYAEVNQRIKAFRMVYPTGFVLPKMISNEDGICLFIAEVGYYVEHNTIADDEKGKKYQDSYLEKVVLATGMAYEKENSTFINKTSYIENCETSAVGRALGMCGFGIDTSVASAEEVKNAIANQDDKKENKPEPVEIKKEIKATPKQIEIIQKLSPENQAKVCAKYKLNTIKDLTLKQASEIIGNLRKKEN